MKNEIELTQVRKTSFTPRYVVHFTNLLPLDDQLKLGVSMAYTVALKRSRPLGGRKFNNKQYGGGIVFESYYPEKLKEEIYNLSIKPL